MDRRSLTGSFFEVPLSVNPIAGNDGDVPVAVEIVK
jgi:hypothetical protein